jgi:nitrate/nitrite transporter NarK
MFRTVLVAVLIALAAAVAWRSSASAQAPTTRTLMFTEVQKGSTFRHIRNTKPKSQRANSLGDLIVFTNPLADASGKKVGKLYVNCATTVGSGNFLKSTLTCAGVVALPDGTLTFAANVSPSAPTTTGAVTGGTGAYAGARGVFVSHETKTAITDTITLFN